MTEWRRGGPAHSGCVGNGSLAPHLDGKYAVYDVTLRIDSCDAEHASLNGDFVGLSTRDSPRASITLLAVP